MKKQNAKKKKNSYEACSLANAFDCDCVSVLNESVRDSLLLVVDC